MRKLAVFAVLVVAVAAVPRPLDGADETQTTEDICTLPPVSGLIACEAYSERWTFNQTAGKCVPYIYGGCRGTANLFLTEVACLLKCDKKALLRAPQQAANPACSQPFKVGPCKGGQKRFYYNGETGSCETFLYGGCQGNDNNFETLDQCQNTCAVVVKTISDVVALPAIIEVGPDPEAVIRVPKQAINPACLEPFKVGPCKGSKKRFYYNAEKGVCDTFFFGGCRGNNNNFETAEECQAACGVEAKSGAVVLPAPVEVPAEASDQKSEVRRAAPDTSICSLPPIKTINNISCLAFIPSWTFNSQLGKCERYIYGGCGKTENLFPTEAECKARCASGAAATRSVNPKVSRDVCLLPKESGPCFASMRVFAFIKEKNRCEIFTYGGCKGNGNNFFTAEDCYKTCGGDTPNTKIECENIECDLKLFQHYAERGCRPQYQPNACCPSRFVCPRERSQSCTYRGVNYAVGESIPQITQDNPCRFACSCALGASGVPRIVCAEPSCVAPQKKANCIPQYSHQQCCPVDYECKDNDSSEEDLNDVCIHNNKTYIKGQYVPSDDPCKSCICLEGADGVKVPNCRDIHCLIQPPQPDCVPVYTKGVCCPTDYKCPSAQTVKPIRIIRPAQEPGTVPVATLPAQVDRTGKGPFIQPVQEPGKVPVATLPARVDGRPLKGKPPFVHPVQEPGTVPVATLPARIDGRPSTGKTPFIRPTQEPGTVPVATLPAVVPGGGSSSAVHPIATIPGGRKGFQVKEERCLLPKDVGPCRGYEPSFYYDADQQQCVQFNYGGCRGNGNRFETAEDCYRVCKGDAQTENEPIARSGVAAVPAIAKLDDCELPPKVGRCRASVPSYFYNVTTNSCQFFVFGGCPFEGNANRFKTVEDCESRCKKPDQERSTIRRVNASPAVTPVARRSEPKSEICNLPAVVGPCRARTPRYHYNAATQTCNKFFYGGCGGNPNNFETQEECLNVCHSSPASAVVVEDISTGVEDNVLEVAVLETPAANPVPAVCSLLPEAGLCDALIPRFFFDPSTRTCKLFDYGGCGGNGNNFATQDECLNTCHSNPATAVRTEESSSGIPVVLPETAITPEVRSAKPVPDVCSLPADVGPCRALKTRYFFNAATQTCETFTYGGCDGNGNNFHTEDECLGRCSSPSVRAAPERKGRKLGSICEQAPEVGPCRGFKSRFFFNVTAEECQPFKYGGCRGNQNNFETPEECQLGCSLAQEVPVVAGIPEPRSIARENPDCSLPVDPGFCRAFKNRYYFDTTDGSCKVFSFGGCNGNANNFHSEEECLSACVREAPVVGISRSARPPAIAEPQPIDDVCALPIVPGPCRGFSEVYGYNTATKQCERFVYGGCKGNANKFSSIEECQQKCESIPAVLGRSLAADECVFGNVTLKVGESIEMEDPCDVCTCDTPPDVTCVRQTCPPPLEMPNANCTPYQEPGQCCPSYGCVPNYAPYIDLCEGTVCPDGQTCKVLSNESGPYAECVAADYNYV